MIPHILNFISMTFLTITDELCFSVKGTIERYKKANSDAPNPASVSEANTQVYIRN